MSTTVENITIFCDSSDGSNIGTPYLTHFRYVIIPSSTSSARSIINIENMSYEEVMDYYGLEY